MILVVLSMLWACVPISDPYTVIRYTLSFILKYKSLYLILLPKMYSVVYDVLSITTPFWLVSVVLDSNWYAEEFLTTEIRPSLASMGEILLIFFSTNI